MIKNFIDLGDFNKTELRNILSFAKKIKKKPAKYSSLMKNRSLGLLFEKQSTRTRLSFSIGMQKLGGNVIELDANKIGFRTRESSSDILKVMSQYLDILMIRNDDHDELKKLASLDIMPIINGLSNFSHPCQILSDVFTIEELLGPIKNKKVVWLGDYNNMLISLIQAAEIFEFKLNILVPKSILKNKSFKLFKNKKFKNSKLYNEVNEGIKNADCVMTDTWISMGEKNINSKKDTLKNFQVNKNIMSRAKKNAIFMHCLPAHRNEEVTDSVIDSKQSVVWEQAKNRMFVQQSILYYLT
jgi:ornithine carbamoyltransferase